MPRRVDQPSASLTWLPADGDLDDLARAACSCQACDLYKGATQAVFGEGPIGAPLFLVGEQPGDREDKLGHPFGGPAGRVLDAANRAVVIGLIEEKKREGVAILGIFHDAEVREAVCDRIIDVTEFAKAA